MRRILHVNQDQTVKMSEEDIPSKLSDAKRLTLAYRELHEVPEPVVAKFAAVARELDLSGNQLTYVKSRETTIFALSCVQINFALRNTQNTRFLAPILILFGLELKIPRFSEFVIIFVTWQDTVPCRLRCAVCSLEIFDPCFARYFHFVTHFLDAKIDFKHILNWNMRI